MPTRSPRWTQLVLVLTVATATAADSLTVPTFVEQNGVVVIEAEDLPLGPGWSRESLHPGYTGRGYIVWRGIRSLVDSNDLTKAEEQKAHGAITIPIRVSTKGKYAVRIHLRVGAGSGHDNNDIYGRVDGYDNGIWHKVTGGVSVFNWGYGSRWLGPANNQEISVNWDPGLRTFSFAGRELGMAIDRIVFYTGSAAEAVAKNPATSGSPVETLVNNPPTVAFTNPTAARHGQDGIRLQALAADPEGRLARVEYWLGLQKLGESSQGPLHEVIWTVPPVGRHSLLVRAVDAVGAIAEATQTIEVVADGSAAVTASAVVEGTARRWHPMALRIAGPEASETGNAPNPFLDMRLQVRFTAPSGRVLDVPGFFDGDGNGGEIGNVWRCRFSPDEAGTWTWRASMRSGPQVAIDLSPTAGAPVAGVDGLNGTVAVAATDPAASGFLKWGRLDYVGKPYLKFADGPYFVRNGSDDPEDLLAYEGFDNTPVKHKLTKHVPHWQSGDPDWGGGRGKGFIGALNYLADAGCNSIYFLTMNLGGDGSNVWPWSGSPNLSGSPSNDNLHFDVSKLGQWNTVFEHASRRGIFLHFVLAEAEKGVKIELDNGTLGTERKLYFRELAARFGHHLALQWNHCEEHDGVGGHSLTPERIREFSAYLRAVDPWRHPIGVHNNNATGLEPYFGDPNMEMASWQYTRWGGWPGEVDGLLRMRTHGLTTGRPMVIGMDETVTWTVSGDDSSDSYAGKPFPKTCGMSWTRRHVLWPALMSGAAGTEHILAKSLSTDDFTGLAKLWNYCGYATRFMQDIPFVEMAPAHELLSGEATHKVWTYDSESKEVDGGTVLAKRGVVYACYLIAGGSTAKLDLTGETGTYTRRWYNPRAGVYAGTDSTLNGGGVVMLGAPPADPGLDWVALVVRQGLPPVNQPPSVSLTSPTMGAIVNAPGSIALAATADDADGSVVKVEFRANGEVVATDASAPFAATWSGMEPGAYTLTAVAWDDDGATTTSPATTVSVLPAGGGNTAPTLSNLADHGGVAGTPIGPIAFTIGDAESPLDSLLVTVASSDQTVAPAAGLVLGGSGANRTLTVTPTAAGTVTITVVVSDGELSSADTAVLTVAPIAATRTVTMINPLGHVWTLRDPQTATVQEGPSSTVFGLGPAQNLSIGLLPLPQSAN